METFSALLALCTGNSPVPGEFPSQRPVTRSFAVFFDRRLNKRLNTSWGSWFETQSRPLWRHSNGPFNGVVWALLKYLIRRLITRSRNVSEPQELCLKLKNRPQIWQAHRQHCDNINYQFRGFETWRDLIGYCRILKQDPVCNTRKWCGW